MPPIELPLTSDGDRNVLVNVGPATFKFHTYYVTGPFCYWYMDILDLNNDYLVAGIKLVPGAVNIIKGLSVPLHEYTMTVGLLSGSAGNPFALGDTLYVGWYNPGQVIPYKLKDPMDYLGSVYQIIE